MPEIQTKFGFPIEIDEEEMARLLGYGDRPMPVRVRNVLREIEGEAMPLVQTACAIRRLDSGLIGVSPFLNELDDAVICLATIGDGVERLVDNYEKSGEIGRAVIANVYGSAAAESAADAANAMIRGALLEEELYCSRRFSPGYGGWDVAEQRWILPALDGATLGVRLTDGCMMIPRKTVTFAVSVGKQPVEMRHDNACDDCDLTNCRYRRKTVVREEGGSQWATFTVPESNFCPRDKWR